MAQRDGSAPTANATPGSASALPAAGQLSAGMAGADARPTVVGGMSGQLSTSGGGTAEPAAAGALPARLAAALTSNPANAAAGEARPAAAAMSGDVPLLTPAVAAVMPLAPTAYSPVPLPALACEPRLLVGVVAAPDVSTVKFADVRAPRLNVGLTLEYRLGPCWRVATGLQRATKEYYARRQYYDWSSFPRASTRDFSWVDASCTILDVPLNLRYDAMVGRRYRAFGTAGLSSFFM